MIYGPPSKIFSDEITVLLGSFSQAYCFHCVVAYLDGGNFKVKGLVTDVFKLEDYRDALDKMNSRAAVDHVTRRLRYRPIVAASCGPQTYTTMRHCNPQHSSHRIRSDIYAAS
ncbi:hypothetical protein BDY19DRAFT_969532 [Irpex rosettiformis]|uniref:Uncharacterized protein n=1 Tax=Irpex rosettiformis TaxID=378272 RepID=A0ACB8TRQ8_9APHY|nr:hypothetical protein BDY19DRAFT_969532 [Irpex rosettiformis]